MPFGRIGMSRPELHKLNELEIKFWCYVLSQSFACNWKCYQKFSTNGNLTLKNPIQTWAVFFLSYCNYIAWKNSLFLKWNAFCRIGMIRPELHKPNELKIKFWCCVLSQSFACYWKCYQKFSKNWNLALINPIPDASLE